MKQRVGKFVIAVILVGLTITLCSAFTPNAITLDFGTRQVVLTEARLQGGWYNYTDKIKLTHGKNLWSRAIKMQDSDTFAGTFPDIVHYIDKIAPQFEIATNDGQINFFPHQKPRFTVSHQQAGRVIDRERLYLDILAALKGNRFPVIKVHYRDVQPTPPADLIARITERAHFTTRCTVNPDRENNIALALQKFNGLRVNPGETVSFNQVVGQRTAEQGFKTAKIIVNGEYTDGIGGGVCQVSTTIFNAAARAGLTIVESHHHTLPSSYIPLGQDAMVSSHADLRFINQTGAPVYFETKFHDHQLSVTIYGRDKGPHVVYRLTTQTTKTITPKDTWTDDTPADLIKTYQQQSTTYERVLVTPGHAGAVVETYLETYQGERRLSKKLLRRSTYQATPNEYTVRARMLTLEN